MVGMRPGDTEIPGFEPVHFLPVILAQVQRHGGRFAPAQVIARACGGAEPAAGPLLDYLEEKFGAF